MPNHDLLFKQTCCIQAGVLGGEWHGRRSPRGILRPPQLSNLLNWFRHVLARVCASRMRPQHCATSSPTRAATRRLSFMAMKDFLRNPRRCGTRRPRLGYDYNIQRGDRVAILRNYPEWTQLWLPAVGGIAVAMNALASRRWLSV